MIYLGWPTKTYQAWPLEITIFRTTYRDQPKIPYVPTAKDNVVRNDLPEMTFQVGPVPRITNLGSKHDLFI